MTEGESEQTEEDDPDQRLKCEKVIAPNWKLPKCPLTEEWVSQLLCIHIVEYPTAMRRNNLPLQARKVSQTITGKPEIESPQDTKSSKSAVRTLIL